MATKLFSKLWRRANKEEQASIGVCEGTWTPVVDGTDVLLTQPSDAMANKAVEVTGMPGARDLQVGPVVGSQTAIAIDDGMVVVFNISGVAVAVLTN